MVVNKVTKTTSSDDACRARLTRACRACIKAKRKCSYELPQCRRCWARNIKCSYENEPFSQAGNGQNRTHIASGSSEARLAKQQQLAYTSSFLTRYLEQPMQVVYLDSDTFKYMVNLAKRHIFMFGLFGGTTFIHQDLKKGQLSRNLQTLARASTSQPQLPGEQCDGIAQEIDYIFNSMLLSAPSLTNLQDTLSLVQSLMLIQIITQFTLYENLSLEHRQRADLRNEILDLWIAKLLQEAPSQLPSSLSRREAFLLAESVRRTIVVNSELRGLQQAARHGYHELRLFPLSLPFEKRMELWHMESEEDFDRAFISGDDEGGKQQIVSWREYVDAFGATDAAVSKYSSFEMMLLVGAMGKQAVEQKLQTSL